MAALEQVMQMKQQGMSERQIIENLRGQGITPKDINEALSQSSIKTAIDPAEPAAQAIPEYSFTQQSPSQELGLPQGTAQPETP